MKELLAMFKVVKSDTGVIATAKGEYEFTGSIIKDTLKILKHKKGS